MSIDKLGQVRFFKHVIVTPLSLLAGAAIVAAIASHTILSWKKLDNAFMMELTNCHQIKDAMRLQNKGEGK